MLCPFKLFFAFAMVTFSAGCASVNSTPFEYLNIGDNQIHTLNRLKYIISADETFVTIGPKHRTDTFDGAPYEISLAALVSNGDAMMVHAERVADESGRSNYDNLEVADWPNTSFRGGSVSCFNLPAEEIDGEHDLMWLRQNGFDPSGTILFSQYFATTPDYNEEIVLSLISHVGECEGDQTLNLALKTLKSRISVAEVLEAE